MSDVAWLVPFAGSVTCPKCRVQRVRDRWEESNPASSLRQPEQAASNRHQGTEGSPTKPGLQRDMRGESRMSDPGKSDFGRGPVWGVYGQSGRNAWLLKYMPPKPSGNHAWVNKA